MKDSLYCSIIITLIVFTIPVLSQNTWQYFETPPGGNVTTLMIDSSGIIYSSASGEGFYRSEDNGLSWQDISTGLFNSNVVSSASDGSTLYIGTYRSGLFKSELYKSLDKGVSWIQLSFPDSFFILDVAVNDSGYIFVCTSGKPYVSKDHGETWAPADSGLNTARIRDFAFNSIGHVFAATASGVFKSTNMGLSWTATGSGLPEMSLPIIQINSQDQLFIGSWGEGYFRSDDNGDNWIPVNSDAGNLVRDIFISDNNDLFAGTDDGLFMSTNNGDSWSYISSAIPNDRILKVVVNSSGEILTGTSGGGIYKSTDNGASWTESNNGYNSADIRGLAFNPEGDIFVSAYGKGIYRSSDDGATWELISNQITTPNMEPIFYYPNTNELFVGTLDGVYRSSDNGNNWVLSNNGFTASIVNFFLANSNGDIFASVQAQGVLRSTTQGHSWDPVSSHEFSTAVQQIAINKQNGYLYAVSATPGVFRSIDNGESWTEFTVGPVETNNRGIVVNKNGYVFVCGYNADSFYRSTDHGQTWTDIYSTSSLSPNKLFVDSSNVLYAVTSRGIFRSNDNGDSWINTNDSLHILRPNCFAVNPQKEVFIGTYGSGIYKLLNPAEAKFAADLKWGPLPLTVHFSDSSAINTTSWQWDFENDGVIDSYDKNPTWVYSEADTYSVKLIVSNVAYSDTLTKKNYIIAYQDTFPNLYSVEDIPNDQGGWIKVNFAGSAFDSDSLIFPKAASAELYTVEIDDGSGWTAATSTAAYGKTYYSVLVPTTKDSTAESDGLINFRVIAAMAEGNYVSDEMTGYSVDNLAPAVPQGLLAKQSGTTIELSWQENSENDLKYYTIYKSTDNAPMESIAKAATPQYVDTEISADDNYAYAISATDHSGNESTLSEVVNLTVTTLDELSAIPDKYYLAQNFPNPFNPSTTIKYGLPNSGQVQIVVYDILGHKVKVLVSNFKSAGKHQVFWNGRNEQNKTVGTGIYYFQIITKNFIQIKKMLYIK